MSTLKFDNKIYEIDALSDECKVHLASIQFVEQEVVRLKAKIAAFETAKVVYLQAFKSKLPSDSINNIKLY